MNLPPESRAENEPSSPVAFQSKPLEIKKKLQNGGPFLFLGFFLPVYGVKLKFRNVHLLWG
jgi:hypothetical protein